MKRFFAGIELDDATRTRCAEVAERLRATGFAAGYQSAEKLHVTLAFLGNVEDARYGEIERALDAAAAGTAPFDLTLDRIGAFPHERNPRIVFLGAREQGAGYRRAAEAVRSAYSKLGFTFADDAVAHVTLARVKGDSPKRPPPSVGVEPIHAGVTELALFESIFDPAARTARYEVRRRTSLSPRER